MQHGCLGFVSLPRGAVGVCLRSVDVTLIIHFLSYSVNSLRMLSFKPDDLHVNEPVHEISNNVVYATSKASDQLAHTRILIRAFASRLSNL